jgi:hypothetical protein
VLQTAAVKVTAFRTPHPPITDNFAFGFETPDGVIVVSSDTNFSPKLAKFARGAPKRHLLDSRTTADDVGAEPSRARRARRHRRGLARRREQDLKDKISVASGSDRTEAIGLTRPQLRPRRRGRRPAAAPAKGSASLIAPIRRSAASAARSPLSQAPSTVPQSVS